MNLFLSHMVVSIFLLGFEIFSVSKQGLILMGWTHFRPRPPIAWYELVSSYGIRDEERFVRNFHLFVAGENTSWRSIPTAEMFKGRFDHRGRGEKAPDIWPKQARGEKGKFFMFFSSALVFFHFVNIMERNWSVENFVFRNRKANCSSSWALCGIPCHGWWKLLLSWPLLWQMEGLSSSSSSIFISQIYTLSACLSFWESW